MTDETVCLEEPEIDFCTLGMFIIDEIEFEPPIPPVYNVIGGAGSYAALGARILSPPPLSKSVGWIVDCGSDFPVSLEESIRSWGTSCVFRKSSDRVTTRGWNKYGEDEHRSFRYTTPKLRLDQYSLSPALLRSKSFHLICSPTRCIDLVKGILDRRNQECPGLARPILVWEPVPDRCVPEEAANAREAMHMVDIVSPNHDELRGFLTSSGVPETIMAETDSGLDEHDRIEELARRFINGAENEDKVEHLALVVRCGRRGCYILAAGISKWVPAVHDSSSGRVVDPTGGGNTFLGGLGVTLARGQDLVTAVMWASVAASIAIEQVGMPRLTSNLDGERWNGLRVEDRMAEFEKKAGWV